MPIKIKSPKSYFFTDPTKISQAEAQAFGPVAGSQNTSEKKFNLTNLFTKTGVDKLGAFAVTDGVLFIVPQKNSTSLVNVFLKPTKQVDLGLKIKYYVYRSIKRENFFKIANNQVELLSKDDPNILNFFIKIWDDFLELNELSASPTTVFEASKLGFSETELKSYQNFFTKNKYNLPMVKIGDQIGNFDDSFGFEVVVDEGDFSQATSDTGFDLKDGFFRAKQCILNLDGNTAEEEIFGNLPTNIPAKVFRESIYTFLDPAAYYGSHVTTNSYLNSGEVYIKGIQSPLKLPKDIFDHVVDKFFNKKKTYIYIKEIHNRSYNFYKNAITPITADNVDESFQYHKWPVKCIQDKFNYYIKFKNIETISCLAYCHLGISTTASNNGIFDAKQLLIEPNDPLLKNSIGFTIPNKNNAFSSIIYLSYSDEEIPTEKLFGVANLQSIFEKADFSSAKGSFINNLRPVLLKDGNDIGLYRTKIVLEGDYSSASDPSGSPTNNDLRTYILIPEITTTEDSSNYSKLINAGYYSSFKNDEEYCKKIFGQGEIWRGRINDGSTPVFYSLLYRRNNIDKELPIYQLGISQIDYDTLIVGINDSTNKFFYLEEETSTSFYVKYKLWIKFDKPDGTPDVTSSSISVYTVDGFYFFSKAYSENFKYYREFSNIAVDFIPQDLSTAIDGYEFGCDYVWYDSVATSAEGNRNYTTFFGKYFNNTTGLMENIDSNTAANFTFRRNKRAFFKYIALKYNSKPSGWRNGGNFPFHTDTYLTLYPKPHILARDVTIKIKFSKNPLPVESKLFIKYNKKYIAINDSTATASINDDFAVFPIPETNYTPTINNSYTINITAVRECDKDIPLEVVAIESGSPDEKSAGKCWIRKNNERYKIDVLLVNCKTNISGTVRHGLPTANEIGVKNKIENYFHQVLLDPSFEIESLDLTQPVVVKDTFKNSYAPTGNIESTTAMFNYVKGLLPSSQQNKMILLFFDELCTDIDTAGEATIINQYIGGALGARIFRPGLPATRHTVAHEALHSIGLYHSFDNNGEFTFEQRTTNNIMDYSTTRRLSWYWQDTKIKNTSNNNKLIIEK